jgi:hypothetical protein
MAIQVGIFTFGDGVQLSIASGEAISADIEIPRQIQMQRKRISHPPNCLRRSPSAMVLLLDVASYCDSRVLDVTFMVNACAGKSEMMMVQKVLIYLGAPLHSSLQAVPWIGSSEPNHYAKESTRDVLGGPRGGYRRERRNSVDETHQPICTSTAIRKTT